MRRRGLWHRFCIWWARAGNVVDVRFALFCIVALPVMLVVLLWPLAIVVAFLGGSIWWSILWLPWACFVLGLITSLD